MLWTALLLIDTARAGCTDPQDLVDVAKTAIVEGRLDDAERAISQVEGSALGCGPSVSADLLARFWLAEGAALAFSGDRESAADSFRAAARVRPGYWNPELGPVAEGWYREAVAAPPLAPGEIVLAPPPARYHAYLDGTAATFPVGAAAGLHLVEVGPPDGPMEFGRFVVVDAGQKLVIHTDLVERAPAATLAVAPEPVYPVAPVPPIPPPSDKRAPWLAIGGAVLAAGAVGSGVLWAGENDAMRDATDLEALDAARRNQRVYSGLGYGLAALSATAFTVEFAF